MTDYFSELNCEPLGEGETPNHHLQIARLMVEGGWAEALEVEWAHLFPDKPPPPASAAVVAALPPVVVSEVADQQCPICVDRYQPTSECVSLPCHHHFHPGCIVPWLNRTNSCPVCRHELPTDDPAYEHHQKRKAEREKRKEVLEEIHDAMFS